MVASVSQQEFEKRLAEQKESRRQIANWKDLAEGDIYEIVSFKFIETKYGKACVITLMDDRKVFAPSTLAARLKTLNRENNLPALIKPKGKTNSKKTGNAYWDYDLVFSNHEE